VSADEENRSWRDRLKDNLDSCMPDDCGCDAVPDGCDIGGCDCGSCMIAWIPLLGLPAVLRERARPTVPARLGLAAIRGYQTGVSAHLPARCRYVPSCSAYAAEAVNRYGLKVGSQLTAARLRRCRRDVPRGTADPLP
jgi:putative membrane protein insertion efficiency factor